MWPAPWEIGRGQALWKGYDSSVGQRWAELVIIFVGSGGESIYSQLHIFQSDPAFEIHCFG